MSIHYEIIKENIAQGKEGCVSVVIANGIACVLKQFKQTKSSARIQREVDFQIQACTEGVAPQVYHVDLDKKQIFMQGLDSLLLDVAKKREPPHLTKYEMDGIENMMVKLDNIGLLHNDGNCRNVMLHQGRLYLIDYGFSKRISKATLRKTNAPNIDYTFKMMKRSFKQNGIKAWNN